MQILSEAVLTRIQNALTDGTIHDTSIIFSKDGNQFWVMTVARLRPNLTKAPGYTHIEGCGPTLLEALAKFSSKLTHNQ